MAAAFDAAFPTLFRAAYNVAFRLVGERTAAEDIAIEATARCALKWSSVEAYAEPWVRRVAANIAFDDLRRRRGRRVGRDRSATVEPTAGDGAVADRDLLVRALLSLPPRQREAVVLRTIGDLTEAQAAQVLSISVGTVKQHYSRGIAALRRVLADEEEP